MTTYLNFVGLALLVGPALVYLHRNTPEALSRRATRQAVPVSDIEGHPHMRWALQRPDRRAIREPVAYVLHLQEKAQTKHGWITISTAEVITVPPATFDEALAQTQRIELEKWRTGPLYQRMIETQARALYLRLESQAAHAEPESSN